MQVLRAKTTCPTHCAEKLRCRCPTRQGISTNNSRANQFISLVHFCTVSSSPEFNESARSCNPLFAILPTNRPSERNDSCTPRHAQERLAHDVHRVKLHALPLFQHNIFPLTRDLQILAWLLNACRPREYMQYERTRCPHTYTTRPAPTWIATVCCL